MRKRYLFALATTVFLSTFIALTLWGQFDQDPQLDHQFAKITSQMARNQGAPIAEPTPGQEAEFEEILKEESH